MERLSDYQKAQKWLEGYEWDNEPDADDNLATICEALQEIEKYKDLEEQGKLLKLPCTAGDTVYEVSDVGVRKHKVICIYLDEDNVPKLDLGWHCTILDNFGKTVFLTREEADAALKEL